MAKTTKATKKQQAAEREAATKKLAAERAARVVEGEREDAAPAKGKAKPEAPEDDGLTVREREARDGGTPLHSVKVLGKEVLVDGRRTSKHGALPHFRALFSKKGYVTTRGDLVKEMVTTFGPKAAFSVANYVALAKKGKLKGVPVLVEDEDGNLRGPSKYEGTLDPKPGEKRAKATRGAKATKPGRGKRKGAASPAAGDTEAQ